MMGQFTDRANGYLSWLRLILPVMVTVGLFWINDLKHQMRDVWLMVEQTRTVVTNDIRHNIASIQQDVAVLATQHQETIRRVEQLEKKR